MSIAALTQAELATQGIGAEREAPHGELGSLDVREQMAKVAFAEGAPGLDMPATAREIRTEMSRSVEVALRSQLAEAIAHSHRLEGSGFEDGCVGLIDVFFQLGGYQQRGLLLVAAGENKRGGE